MIPLDQIQVPKPCEKDWDAMDGDARRRFCAGCGCHVHNLSAMTRAQAQALLDGSEGRVCVRFQTRPDGTPLTQDDAPAERSAFWPRRLAAVASWSLAVLLTGLGLMARAEPSAHKMAPKTGQSKSKPHAAKAVSKRPLFLLGDIVMPRHPQKPTMGVPLPPPPPPKSEAGKPE